MRAALEPVHAPVIPGPQRALFAVAGSCLQSATLPWVLTRRQAPGSSSLAQSRQRARLSPEGTALRQAAMRTPSMLRLARLAGRPASFDATGELVEVAAARFWRRRLRAPT